MSDDVKSPAKAPKAAPAPAPLPERVRVYNRHVAVVAGIAPGKSGEVSRGDLERWPWALRAEG